MYKQISNTTISVILGLLRLPFLWRYNPVRGAVALIAVRVPLIAFLFFIRGYKQNNVLYYKERRHSAAGIYKQIANTMLSISTNYLRDISRNHLSEKLNNRSYVKRRTKGWTKYILPMLSQTIVRDLRAHRTIEGKKYNIIVWSRLKSKK